MATEGEPLADWQRPELRAALARRDISEVYRLLRRWGVSQRRIAACTGQSQSEVHDIVRGRAVRAYDVLARIADGLGIPREYLGLAPVPAYRGDRDGDAPNRDGHPGGDLEAGDESVKRRRFLANAAAAVLGEAALGEATAVAEPAAEPTLPGRVGLADVARLEAVTAQLRGLDYRYGGGAAWDAVVAHVRSAERMLTATMTDTVRPVLHRGVADVHNLAAWTAFDLGLLDHARYHYGRALEHAKQAEDPTLCAFLLCGAGHVYLFHDAPDEALKFFQLAEYPAAESRIGLIHLVTSCYQARAYSELGVADRAVGLVARSEDVYAAAIDADGIPNWLWYFCAGGRHSLRANVHAALSRQHPAHLTPALEAMRASVNEHQPGLERGNVIDLAGLATLHLRAGNVNHGLRLGHAVVGKAEVVASRHVRDRLRPLAAAAARVGGADGRDLARAVHRAVG